MRHDASGEPPTWDYCMDPPVLVRYCDRCGKRTDVEPAMVDGRWRQLCGTCIEDDELAEEADDEADVCDCGQCAACAESAQCAAEAKEDR